MPACEPWCPLVKAQLKKIVTEAPWILKKELPSSGDRAAIFGKARDSELDIVDEKFVTARSDDEHDDVWEKEARKARKARKAEEDSEPSDIDYYGRRIREPDGKPVSSIDVAAATVKDVLSKSQTTMVSKAKTESATQWSVGDEGHDKLVETDAVEQVTRYAGDSKTRLSERERMEKMKQADRESSKHEPMDEREDFPIFQDECDPSCPRRISRKSRVRKLEERQSTVDSYLLNKGFGYFEDVCTCSLSCVLRTSRHDSFVRSILISAALFTLGLKLCSELDAWYLPIRFS